MSQSSYAWCGSPIHLFLDDELADNYNKAISAYFEAQKNHKIRTGSTWNPEEALRIDWTDKMQNAYEAIGKLINLLIEVNGGSLNLTADDLKSDYLVKL